MHAHALKKWPPAPDGRRRRPRLARYRPIAALLAAMAVMGCASRPGPLEPWTADAPEARAARAAWEDGPASAASPATQANRLALPPDAGPEDYVRLALERAPALRAARYRIARLTARVPQATSLEDPMLEITPFGEGAQTAAGEAGLMAGVSQRFAWPAKLEARGRVAQQDAAVAAAELTSLELQVAADVRRAYWQLYAAERALEQTRRGRPLIEQVRDAATAGLRAGQGAQQDVLRAGVELGELDRRLTQFQQQRSLAAAALNRLLDRPPDAPVPSPAALDPQAVALEQDQLLDQAAQRHPALRVIREELEAYRQQLRLARMNHIPDLTVSLDYTVVDDEGLAMTATGDDQWSLGFGINLPIWGQKYEAAEREARAGMLESLAQLQARQREVVYDVQAAWLAVQSRQEQAALLREQILPQSRQALDAALSGYRAGQTPFTDTLEAWQRLLALELIHEQNLADLGAALADLRQAVGGDWPDSLSLQPAATQPEVQP